MQHNVVVPEDVYRLNKLVFVVNVLVAGSRLHLCQNIIIIIHHLLTTTAVRHGSHTTGLRHRLP